MTQHLARRRMAADDGAFDRAGEASVSPVAGEEQATDTRDSTRTCRFAGGQGKSRVLFAHDGAAEKSRASSATQGLRHFAGGQGNQRIRALRSQRVSAAGNQ